MFKKLFTIASLLSVNIVLANPLFSKLYTSPENKLATITSFPVSIKATNFSGQWVGMCNDVEEVVTISQDETSITIDGERFELGKMKTLSESHESYDEVIQALFYWKENKSQIFFNFVNVTVDNSEENEPMDVIVGKTSFSIEKNMLTRKTSSNSYFDGEIVDSEKFKQQCVYKKAN